MMDIKVQMLLLMLIMMIVKMIMNTIATIVVLKTQKLKMMMIVNHAI